METIEQRQAALIRESYTRHTSFEDIRKSLDDKLHTGVLDKLLHAAAIAQLDGLIEKAKGEGSRGGKVIGHTKSGKPIYASASHPKHASFSYDDHKDAVHAHVEMRRKAAKDLSLKTATSKQLSDAADIRMRHTQQARKHLGEMSKVVKVLEELTNFKKALPQDLQLDDAEFEKAATGEGSRGGHIIGHTKSGKPVYANGKIGGSTALKRITSQDHKDAAQLHFDTMNEHHAKAHHAPTMEDRRTHTVFADHHRDAANAHMKHSGDMAVKEREAKMSPDEKKILADHKKKQANHHQRMAHFH